MIDILNEQSPSSDGVLFLDAAGTAQLFITEGTVDGPTKFRGKFQEANSPNKNKREYPHEVLAQNIERLMETIKSRGLVGELDHACCRDSDFDVLTVNGWKPFVSIRKGDYVYSRMNGMMVESRVNEIIDEPYDGPMYEVKGRSIDCTFTPNHRFLLSKRQDYKKNNEQFYATIEEIHNNRKKYGHSPIPKTATWEGEDKSDLFVLPGSDRKGCRSFCNPNGTHWESHLVFNKMKFAAFLGIYLAEGCLSGTNGVSVTQINEIGRNLIRELLKTLHPDITWREDSNGFHTPDARLHDFLVPLGDCYSKYIPSEVKNFAPEYLEELIHWFAIGDGRMLACKGFGEASLNCKSTLTVENNGNRLDLGDFSRLDIFSVSNQLIDDLHECIIKTGRCASKSTVITEEDYQYAKHTIKASIAAPLYQLHISRSNYIHTDLRFMRITQVHHTGRVYCLSVDHHNFYMRYRGKSFWTGNSDSIIHFEKASHLITDLWWEGNVLMGEGEILPTPHGRILESLIKSGVRVGISSRGVGNGQVRPGDGVLVIGESYKLITFDIVADPSTFSAYQKIVTGSQRRESVTPSAVIREVPVENFSTPEKNESTRINNVNNEAFVAYIGQLIRRHIDEIKNEI